MTTYRALQTVKTDHGFTTDMIELPALEAGDGELVVAVEYSSVNYKDGLSAAGNPGVTRQFPHVPGIDAVGRVLQSNDDGFAVAERVLVTGYDLGMNTDGGLAEQLKIPASWALKLPADLSALNAMALGTAGLTAYLCLDRLERAGLQKGASIIVSGAGGGVGSVAVALASSRGYRVTASSGKAEQGEWLTALGAAEVIDRSELSEENKRPMLKPRWDAGIDCVGGFTLANMVKQITYGGHVSACGLAQSADLPLTVLPFILNGVGLLGVDSVELPLSAKQAAWQALSQIDDQLGLEKLFKVISLEQSVDALSEVLTGSVLGRTVVDVNR
ncbi:Acrylyl-CoA reductase AcuI [Sinobacterium norvegicum]|uniref:Acrylyl-CoA reductase AcuI n=1 Tax=Sinobacterium norvegicum TaxID=1641715 RepID=A0ABM9AA68_9GAMM|nr:YhdH/YhfP family quinone oxidoreductase [Sinobacterium norvegicum]CAH0990078.1 Acrylyl-CoA reductase AcuI [Sinobacterium norvegicum]